MYEKPDNPNEDVTKESRVTIQELGHKLDRMAADLSEDERVIFVGLLRLARKAFADASRAQAGICVRAKDHISVSYSPATAVPRLSEALLDAFNPSRISDFRIGGFACSGAIIGGSKGGFQTNWLIDPPPDAVIRR